MRILILGAAGMLGSMAYRVLTQMAEHEVWGTVRSHTLPARIERDASPGRVIANADMLSHGQLEHAFERACPDVAINCIGIIKQLPTAEDPLVAIPVNALLPHRIAKLAAQGRCRVVHISTDCVFSGAMGAYTEESLEDALDLYGRSKLLGELHDAHCVTLRTSIIGHEFNGNHGLLEWFLSQTGEVKGFARAIFSGLPTYELSRVIADVVVPNSKLAGLYHVAAAPISKLELLRLIAEIYGKTISICPSEDVVIDRSLDASKFGNVTGYRAPAWRQLIASMHANR